MTDRNAILEALARAIHCHDGRLPTPWDADMIARWPDPTHKRDKTEYRRADLPPTLSAAMELPEVRALVERLDNPWAADDGLEKGAAPLW